MTTWFKEARQCYWVLVLWGLRPIYLIGIIFNMLVYDHFDVSNEEISCKMN